MTLNETTTFKKINASISERLKASSGSLARHCGYLDRLGRDHAEKLSDC